MEGVEDIEETGKKSSVWVENANWGTTLQRKLV